MTRFEWGPQLGEVRFAPGVAPNGKPDVALTFAGLDKETGEVTFELPPYDPATHNQPSRIHVVIFPRGVDMPDDPGAALAHDQAVISSIDVPPTPGGAEVVVPRPTGIKADVPYNGRSVLEFADPDPTPAPTDTGTTGQTPTDQATATPTAPAPTSTPTQAPAAGGPPSPEELGLVPPPTA